MLYRERRHMVHCEKVSILRSEDHSQTTRTAEASVAAACKHTASGPHPTLRDPRNAGAPLGTPVDPGARPGFVASRGGFVDHRGKA